MRLHVDCLVLPTLPFAFTQDELFTTDDFVRRSEQWGVRLDDAVMQALHEARHLLPLFRVSDDSIVGRVIAVPAHVPGASVRNLVLDAAATGRLRDPAVEGHSLEWPYVRPRGNQSERWWNGFVFSSWQLLELVELGAILGSARIVDRGSDLTRRRVRVDAPRSPRTLRSRRARTLVLVALSSRYLPDLLGRESLQAGEDWARFRELRSEQNILNVISRLGLDAMDLYPLADDLLFRAYCEDPLREWLPLVRHMPSHKWEQLRGPALVAVWQRIGAELLLRAHEELAEIGAVQALGDVPGGWGWHPLNDRLAGKALEREPLESVLSRFGLSPHPRVLLLVEGATEQLHIGRLLALLASETPDFVRVQTLGGARTNPQLLARYAVSPRLGTMRKDGWELAVPPTALYVVADPEGRWETPTMRARQERVLKREIRKDVEAQGARIEDDVLDLLVRSHAWEEGCFELANFSEDELMTAIEALAIQRDVPDVATELWRKQVRDDLIRARTKRLNLDIVLRHARASKLDLAEELWPKLEAKAIAEVSSGATTPVVNVVFQAIDLATRIHRGGTVVLPTATDGDPPCEQGT